MSRCTRCNTNIPAANQFCGRCGAPASASSETEAGAVPHSAAPAGAAAAPARARWSQSGSAAEEGRFPPGTVLARRYRIAGRLGKGGMGEVYKATDLLLGQAVALKFLPEPLADNEAMLERFRNEVRLARQVSHPNVCRVYDIGEAEGQLFLTMEFVDGEDLASLLRRIGQLPAQKALEMARRLGAGLAAAHEKGVLHRDLKPANIMIDARGHVLITDFGLAAAEDAVKPGDVRSGTPAYMAPEQLTGREVTPRSDIYALGLVLYEMFTGHHPFPAKTAAELLEKQQAGPPPMKDIDPAIERAVIRCLEADSRRRPATALSVVAALPGGDPLAAALAAGETPSPEMVAAAGQREGMQPRLALACLALLVAAVLFSAWLAAKSSVISAFPSDITPQMMAHQARGLLARLGYSDRPHSEAWGFAYDLEAIKAMPADRAAARARLAAARPRPLYFWYRGSPTRLIPLTTNRPVVDERDPPFAVGGMVLVRLDPEGRLESFRAAPPEREDRSQSGAGFDWKLLFEAAGLDMGRFTPSEPLWTPRDVFDIRGSWRETGAPDPLRVEAAAWRGRPTFFRLARASQASQLPAAAPALPVPGLFLVFMTASIAAALALAWRSLQRGRADRRAATRLAAFLIATGMLGRFLAAPHALDSEEFFHFTNNAGIVLFWSGFVAAAYLALEPFVRRRWPHGLVTWLRLINGEFRDPLVARDLLIGLTAGACLTVLFKTHELLYGLAAPDVRWALLYTATSPSRIPHLLLTGVLGRSIMWTFAFVLVLLAANSLFRRRWAAICVAALVNTVFVREVLSSAHPILSWSFGLAPSVLIGWYTFRWGFLCSAAGAYAVLSGMSVPMTLDTSAWYFPASAAAMAVIIGLGLWAMRTALAGQPLWKEEP